ncbi:MAG: hypothetical protein KatS3mg015_2177 [Fimbriimonadales bacterium]|nr:MAG: hypothetical protein KatS3mg015_2177 [Fimbriimonadales bacterium]
MDEIRRHVQQLRKHLWINYALIMALFACLMVTLVQVIRFAESVVHTNEQLLELKHRVDSLDAKEGGRRE